MWHEKQDKPSSCPSHEVSMCSPSQRTVVWDIPSRDLIACILQAMYLTSRYAHWSCYEKGKKIIAATTEYKQFIFFYFKPEKSIRKPKDSSGFCVIQNQLSLSKAELHFQDPWNQSALNFLTGFFYQSLSTSYYRSPSDSLWQSLITPMVVWIELSTKWLICLTCCLASESNHWEEIGFWGLCLIHGFIHWAFHNLITVLRDDKTSEGGPR